VLRWILQESGDFTWRESDCEELVGVTWRVSDFEELVGVTYRWWWGVILFR